MSQWSDYLSKLSGLRSWWRMGDGTSTFQDSGPANLPLTETGGTTTDAPGLLPWDPNRGRSFAANGGRANRAGYSIASTWTIGCLYQTSDATATSRFMVNYVTSSQGLYLNNAQFLVFWLTGGPAINAGVTSNDGKPHLAVATWDGSVITLYQDGVQRAQQAPAVPANADWSGGQQMNVGGQTGSWAGVVDEAFTLTRPLSAQEVRNLWTAYNTPRLRFAQIVADMPGLFAWWRLGETSGAFKDSGPGHYDTTATPAAAITRAAGLLPNDSDGGAKWTSGSALAGPTSTIGTLPALGDSWTWSALFRADVGSSAGAFMRWGSTAVQLYVNPTPALTFTPGSNTIGDPLSSYNIRDGLTHHAVVTWDGTNLLMYRDGWLIGSQVRQPGVNDSWGPWANLNLGAGQNMSMGGAWVGTLDEILLLSRPMTLTEVQTLYRSVYQASQSYPQKLAATSGQAHYWKLGGAGPWQDSVAGGPSLADSGTTGAQQVAGLPADADGALSFTSPTPNSRIANASIPALPAPWTVVYVLSLPADFPQANATAYAIEYGPSATAFAFYSTATGPTAVINAGLNVLGGSTVVSTPAQFDMRGKSPLVLAFVVNGAVAQLYANGGLVYNRTSFPGTMTAYDMPAGALSLGPRPTQADGRQTLDEVAIFSRALTQAEINTLWGALQVPAAPTLAGLSPTYGPGLGGTAVVATGTGFVLGSTVSIDGGAAIQATFISPTQLSFVTPAHAATASSITVTTPFGATSNSQPFTFLPPPTLTGISPNQGTTLGGDVITLTGTGFVAGTTVKVDSTTLTPIVLSDTQLTYVNPALAAGPHTVTVTTVNGTSSGVTFTALAPPQAPQNLVASPAGWRAVSLEWDPPAQSDSPVTGYVVEWDA